MWLSLKKPIIGLAPMDGITDPAFRYMVDKYGHADILFTEFVSAAALSQRRSRVFSSLIKHQTNTPIVLQLFGNNPDDFYKAAIYAAGLGFSGIDINMGCPDRNISRKGGGAGLIKQPNLAKEIISAVKQAIKDSGNRLSNKPLPIPVSVKTRIGYDTVITESWISNLLEAKPNAITVHGRTLKQLYHGKADWREIAKAGKLCKKENVVILGSGDVKSVSDAENKYLKYNIDGVLIGRAALGNPWIFSGHVPSLLKRKNIIIEHCQKFMDLTPENNFLALRKHLVWYTKGFFKAAQFRNQLMKVKSLKDVKLIMENAFNI